MPSTSAKQAKFMRAVAHSPGFAKKVGVPQSVGKDFNMADKKMKKFGDGGKTPMATAGEKKMGDALMMTKRGRDIMAAQKRDEAEKDKAGAAKRARADKLLGIGMKKGGMMADKAGRAMTRKTPDTMGRAMTKKCGGGSMKKYASGGLVGGHKSADGVATKGKTKGKMVAMARGGMVEKMTPRAEFRGVERKKGGKC